MKFAPVGRMAEDTFLLWVHKNEGITSFDQFLEEAKSRGKGWDLKSSTSRTKVVVQLPKTLLVSKSRVR